MWIGRFNYWTMCHRLAATHGWQPYRPMLSRQRDKNIISKSTTSTKTKVNGKSLFRLFIVTFGAYPRIVVKCKTNQMTNSREIMNIPTLEQTKHKWRKISRRNGRNVKMASCSCQNWKPRCQWKRAPFILNKTN